MLDHRCLWKHKYVKYSSPLVEYTSTEECILSNNNDNGLFVDHVMNPTK